MLIAFAIFIVLLILFSGYWYAWLPAKNGLRVLMYHKVADGPEDGLSVRPATLKKHLDELGKAGFQPITLTELHQHLHHDQTLPTHCFLLTFDDGYRNNPELAAPVLAAFGVKPVVFIPTAFVGKTNEWDHGSEPIMTLEELQSIQNLGWDIGLHGHLHKHLGALSPEEAKTDLATMMGVADSQKLSIQPTLAYPYGGRPKKKEALNQLIQTLKHINLVSAFRIGNRINSLPIENAYLIQRLDIKGNMTDLEFKRKVKYGKVV